MASAPSCCYNSKTTLLLVINNHNCCLRMRRNPNSQIRIFLLSPSSSSYLSPFPLSFPYSSHHHQIRSRNGSLLSSNSNPNSNFSRPIRGGGGDGGRGDREEEEEEAAAAYMEDGKDFVTISACVVGLLTGLSVVLFNTAVHEIRDLFWDGLPSRGASWLREEPINLVWQRVILVPVCGGVLVSILNTLRDHLETPSKDNKKGFLTSDVKSALRPFLKAIAASVTLGTGNSLGPEGPSVEIGSAIAKGVSHVFRWNAGKRLSLIASGSAAGISSGFNAAVAGCFFAVESVLWPSPADSSSPLTNSTPMVILSSVIASVVSEVGLGSDPAFTVPEYDFRSPSGTVLFTMQT